jgi:hypothetical protein
VDQLQKINELLKVKLRVQQNAYKKFLDRENRIRTDIAKLTEQSKVASKGNDYQMRAIGADVIWQSWIGRSKSALNMQLAEILAQKSHYIEHVRIAHGKADIADKLLENRETARRKTKAQRELDGVLQQDLFAAKARD